MTRPPNPPPHQHTGGGPSPDDIAAVLRQAQTVTTAVTIIEALPPRDVKLVCRRLGLTTSDTATLNALRHKLITHLFPSHTGHTDYDVDRT